MRNAIKRKFIYNGRGIVFDGEGLWSFDNDFARNVAIFGADNSLSSHTYNRKSDFLVSVEGPTDGISESTRWCNRKKNLVLMLIKQRQHFA